MDTLPEDLCALIIIKCWILLRMRYVSDESCRENQNTHFMSRNFFQKSCQLRGNVEKYDRAPRPQMKI